MDTNTLLEIKIPSLNLPHPFIEFNLTKLKNKLVHLETPHAIKNMSPELRREQIRLTTEKFRQFLQLKHDLESDEY